MAKVENMNWHFPSARTGEPHVAAPAASYPLPYTHVWNHATRRWQPRDPRTIIWYTPMPPRHDGDEEQP